MTHMRLAIAGLAILGISACSPKTANDGAAQEAAAGVSGEVAGETAKAEGAAQVVAAGKDNLLDCTTPVTAASTYKSLSGKFRDDAQLGNIPGAEGSESKGLILYDKIPARKLYVTFWDDAMEHVANVAPGENAVAWTGADGIHIGSTLSYIEALNGRPFTISGFEWDYGGYVVDFKGGKLDRMKGGCTLSLRFGAGNDSAIPDGISGDGVTVSSDDARVRKWAPVVSEMSVGWPLPPGVKPSEGQ